MASFKIPHGKTYTFSITVLEKNSYLPKNITNMDETSSFKLVKLSDLSIVPGTCIVSKVPDDKLLPTDPDTFLNGRVSVTIPDSITSTLVYERGDKVDGYYYKPVYEGVVTIGFSDAQADIIAVVPDIYVVPTGIVV